MQFTCHTTYNQKALTALARAVRKTIRAKRSRWGHPGRFCVSEIRQGREWCRCGAAFALNPLGFLSPTPEVECAPKV